MRILSRVIIFVHCDSGYTLIVVHRNGAGDTFLGRATMEVMDRSEV